MVSGCAQSDPVSPLAVNRPRFDQAPADGNGGKIVIPVDVDFPDFPTCPNGTTLSLHVAGWVQIHVRSKSNNRNVELDNVQLVFTYSNAAGLTFQWHEVGVDHYSITPDGDLVVASMGRNGFNGIIGRIVTDAVTGEVRFEAGKPIALRDDQACAALT